MKSKINYSIKIVIMSLSLLLISLQPGSAQSQDNSSSRNIVENVKYSVSEDGNIIILYNLMGEYDQLYNISLQLKRASNPDLKFYPKSISGDVGENETSGMNKKIIWEIEKDYPGGLSGTDFYFVIQAEKMDSESNAFLWAGLGVAAAVAAVAVYFLASEEDESTDDNKTSSFPLPPVRP